MKGSLVLQKGPRFQKDLSLNEFMNIYDKEEKRRGRFFRHQMHGFPGYDPRFALLNRNKMHKRRKLRHFGFGYGDPHHKFGRFLPPPMRYLSVPKFQIQGPHFETPSFYHSHMSPNQFSSNFVPN